MVEILAPERMLETLKGMSPLRRVLLATGGTLQGALSAYFGEPVDVEVVGQDEPDTGHLAREVRLVCRERGLVACRARTEIEVESEEARKLILEQRLGLGQICEVLGVRTTFALDDAGERGDTFWRRYRLEAPGLCFRIHEEFPAELFPDA